MIIDDGSFVVAIDIDVPETRLETVSRAAGHTPVEGMPIDFSRRATVEVYRRVSGLPQHALLGGVVHPPSGAGGLAVKVALTGETVMELPTRNFMLPLPLTPGLPDEFGRGVLSGVVGGATRPGLFSIDRGAYHPAESSHLGFYVAGFLVAAILQRDASDDIEELVSRKLKILR